MLVLENSVTFTQNSLLKCGILAEGTKNQRKKSLMHLWNLHSCEKMLYLSMEKIEAHPYRSRKKILPIKKPNQRKGKSLCWRCDIWYASYAWTETNPYLIRFFRSKSITVSKSAESLSRIFVIENATRTNDIQTDSSSISDPKNEPQSVATSNEGIFATRQPLWAIQIQRVIVQVRFWYAARFLQNKE